MEELPRTPIYRSIDPGGRYRTVCVRLCDGFFYPIHYSTYGSMVGPDAEACQSSCAAPAELYVYRNPGQEIEQAVSLSGSAYMDLPVALRYRKEYVKGCSCKQAEYNPTEIMAANKQAGIDTGPMPPAAPPQAAAPAPAAGGQTAAPGDQPVEITGATPPADQAAPPPVDQAAPPPADAAAPPPQRRPRLPRPRLPSNRRPLLRNRQPCRQGRSRPHRLEPPRLRPHHLRIQPMRRCRRHRPPRNARPLPHLRRAPSGNTDLKPSCLRAAPMRGRARSAAAAA